MALRSDLPASSTSVNSSARGGASWLVVTLSLVGSVALALVAGSHVIFTIIVLPIVISLAWSNPTGLVSVLVVWMTMLGFVRRFTPGGGNVTFSGDPVLLIGPIAIILVLLVVLSSGGIGKLTKLGRVVLAFNVVALLEAFNPSQGNLLTGLGGLLFIMVPTLAYWIGLRYGTEVLLWRLAWTIAMLSLFVSLYGLYQQFVGFPTWDSTWIESRGYSALNLGSGVIRAFGTFSSAQEYAVFLGIGVVTWAALATRNTRWPLPLHLAALATVASALYFESQRTSIFITVLALGIIFAARRKMRPLTVAVFGVASIALLMTFAGTLSGGSGSSAALSGPGSTASILSGHALSGITDPTGAGSSLPGHIKATRQGIAQGFSHPLGHGSGSVNLASSRYGANLKVHGTEYDPGNMGIAFGLAGLILYVLLVWRVSSTGYRLAVQRRDSLGIFVLGLVMAALLQWTNGNLYSVCWLVWLAIGAADRLLQDGATTPAPNLEPVTSPSFEWRKPGAPRRSIAR